MQVCSNDSKTFQVYRNTYGLWQAALEQDVTEHFTREGKKRA